MKDWAEKAIKKYQDHDEYEAISKYDAVRLLQADHARTLRILARLKNEAKLNQYQRTATVTEAYLAALKDVRAAVQKGRG